MEHLPEQIREQLEAQKPECIFCRILAGEIPSKQVYADDLVAILLDINPAVKGHALLMPKEHYPILPLISPAEFDRVFGLMPQFAGAIVDAVIADGLTAFIANGAAAGQQSPHFLVHLLPRERGDGLDMYDFRQRQVDESQAATVEGTVKQVLALMLEKHLGVKSAPGAAFFEGDTFTIDRSPNEQAAGHLEIRPKGDMALGAITYEHSIALFKAASLASTALFENLGCDATNIIADAQGGFVIHVIPRRADDGLALLWSPMSQPPDPGEVASSLSKKLFDVQVRIEKGELDAPSAVPPQAPKPVGPERPASQPEAGTAPAEQQGDVRARIDAAWDRLRGKQI